MLSILRKIAFACAVLGACFVVGNKAMAATSTGTLESTARDLGDSSAFGQMSWAASSSASSTIVIKVRTATTSDMAAAPSWSSCAAVGNGSNLASSSCVAYGHRFIQYQISFRTDYVSTSTFVQPSVSNIRIESWTIGSLVSSPYNTTASDGVIRSIGWAQSLTGKGNIRIQLRTSPDGLKWTPWIGSAGTSTYYTNASGAEAIFASQKDSVGDQWLQYKVSMDTGGSGTVRLTGVTVTYQALVPVVSGLTPDNVEDNSTSTLMTITGADFDPAATVKVISQGREFAGENIEVVSSSTINCILPLTKAFGGYADVYVVNPNGAKTSKPLWIKKHTAFLTSAVHDLGIGPSFGQIRWTAVTPAGTALSFKIRTASSSNMASSTDWDSCSTINSGSPMTTSNCVVDGQHFIQYQVRMDSSYPAAYIATSSFITPTFSDLSYDYTYYPTGSFISTPYDSTDPKNAVSRISWDENALPGAVVKMQLRTAPDNAGEPGAWSAWAGSTGIGSYYSDRYGNERVYGQSIDSVDNRWIQYRAVLSSDGLYSPVLKGVEISYQTRMKVQNFSSDRISTSWPATNAVHEITFNVRETVPAGGKVVAILNNSFATPAGFRMEDVKLSLATDLYSTFSEQAVDEVSMPRPFIFSFNNLPFSIPAGMIIRLNLGTKEAGGTRIINPAALGSYDVTMKTFNNLSNNIFVDNPIESSKAMVAIVDSVGVNAGAPRIRSNGRPTGVLLASAKTTQLQLTTNYSAICRYSLASNTPYADIPNNFSATGTRDHSAIVSVASGNYYNYYVRCKEDGSSYVDTDDFLITFSVAFGGSGGSGGGTGGGNGTGVGPGSGPGTSSATSTISTTTPGNSSSTGTGTGTGTSGSGSGSGAGDGSGSGTGSGTGSSGTGSGSTFGDGSGDSTRSGGSGGGGGGTGGGTGAGAGNSTSPGGGGGGGGGGTGAGEGAGTTINTGDKYPPKPGDPILNISGWAAPGAQVIILRDGAVMDAGRITSDNDARFNLTINNIPEAVYTFSIFDYDSDAKKSAKYSATFALKQNSITNLNKVIVPPTISVSKTNVAVGESLNASGQSVPNATIETWLEPIAKMSAAGTNAVKKQIPISSNGRWAMSISANGLPQGVYNLKARTVIKDIGPSDFGDSFTLGVGQSAGSGGECRGADLNHDGKVNLIDFSILLFHWGTNNACADQNHDGKANLIDFSILLYNWTG